MNEGLTLACDSGVNSRLALGCDRARLLRDTRLACREQLNLAYHRDLNRRTVSKQRWIAGNFVPRRFHSGPPPPSLAASGHSKGKCFCFCVCLGGCH